MNRNFCIAFAIISIGLCPAFAGAMIQAIELPPPNVKPVKAIELPPPNVKPVAAVILTPVKARVAPYSDYGEEIQLASASPSNVNRKIEKTEPVKVVAIKEPELEYRPVIRDIHATPQDYNPANY